jgi:hypothetical protein
MYTYISDGLYSPTDFRRFESKEALLKEFPEYKSVFDIGDVRNVYIKIKEPRGERFIQIAEVQS